MGFLTPPLEGLALGGPSPGGFAPPPGWGGLLLAVALGLAEGPRLLIELSPAQPECERSEAPGGGFTGRGRTY